ncbi:hypothetical protein ACWDOR_46235 [Streptosporangium canum]|uniref:hypothetical protein n=1 Tax=Streptosporangium canum TaxID=324952 RepID=UPI00368A2AAB
MPLTALVKIASIRWAVEESFQAAKGQVGLDHYRVRGWIAWHRHTTLAMLALAFLAAVSAPQPRRDKEHTVLTMPEIHRLLAPSSWPAAAPPGRFCTGHNGATAIKRPPGTATTSADPYHDREMSLE